MARASEMRLAPAGVEVRENGDGTVTLRGYASTYNEPYNMGGYTETVKPTAFRETLGRTPDVRLLVNHDGPPLARTKSGTMTLSSDTKGLLMEARLDPSDPDVQALLPKIRRGDMDQMSFAFRVTAGGDEWFTDSSGRRQRSLTNLDLSDGDVSVVTYPANPGTLVGVRSLGVPYEAAESCIRAMAAGNASADDVIEAVRQILSGDTEGREQETETEEAEAPAAEVDTEDPVDEIPETTEDDAQRASVLAAAEQRRRMLAAL